MALPSLQTAVDLFGEVPVSRREVRLWLWKVPVWFSRHAPQARVDAYLRGWDVVGKIRRAKAAGELAEILGDEACPHCGALLEPDQPGRMTPWRPAALPLRGWPGLRLVWSSETKKPPAGGQLKPDATYFSGAS